MKWNNKLSKDEYSKMITGIFKEEQILFIELEGIYNQIKEIADDTTIVNDDIINSVLWMQESIAIAEKKKKKINEENKTNKEDLNYLGKLKNIVEIENGEIETSVDVKKVPVIAFYILCTIIDVKRIIYYLSN